MLARFLWASPDLSRKMHALSWEKFCKPFKEGGLNIQRVKEMNNMGSMKQLWWLLTNKESLWVKWTHAKYLMHEFIWTVQELVDCSWVWRRVLKVRNLVEPYVITLIGIGQSTQIWLDKWHKDGVFCKLYGEDIYQDVDMGKYSMVSCILNDEGWQSSGSSSDILRPS